jgi:hypothetical protein
MCVRAVGQRQMLDRWSRQAMIPSRSRWVTTGNPGEVRGMTCPIPLNRSPWVRLAWSASPWLRTQTRCLAPDKSATSGAAVPSDARQLSGNEASALPPSDASPTRDTPPLARLAVLRKVKLQDTSMSTPQPQPPLRPGDCVRYIYDYDHIEIVESCELSTAASRMPKSL